MLGGMATLSTEIVGEGTPVVALHGFGPDRRLMAGMLEPVLGELDGFRRVYLDLPGCGSSAAREIRSTADVLAAVEQTVTDTVGDEPFLLVGESYGGYLATELTRQRPDQVLGLALVCPVVVPMHAERTVPKHTVIERDETLMSSLDADELATFEPLAVVQTRETFERFCAEIGSGLVTADDEALERIQSGGYALPECEALSYDRPTLILTGRQDSVVGYADQWALLERFPRATFAVLDAAGHNAQIERPDVTSILLRDWLARCAHAAR